MTKAGALFIAAGTCPLVVAVPISAWIAISWKLPLFSMAAFLPITYIFALWAEVLLGGPLLLLGWRLNLIRWWSAMIAGFIAGGMTDLVLHSFYVPTPIEIAEMSGFGAACGFVFWLILSLGRDQPSERVEEPKEQA